MNIFLLSFAMIMFAIIGIIVYKLRKKKRVEEAKGLAYFFTNNNIIFKTNHRTNIFYAIPLSSVREIKISQNTRGNGTIYIIPKGKEEFSTDISNNNSRPYPTFELMRDVRKLQIKLNRLLKNAVGTG